MQKVYLLLRSNQQTGPYNLQELLQFDLKPYDLIWIEGKSAGWYYPQEIKALQPHLSFLNPAPAQPITNTTQPSAEKTLQPAQPKKIFVSMPSHTKEEPTPKPSFATVSTSGNDAPEFSEPVQPKKETEEIKTSYSKSMQEVETDYMNWAYQKKAKKRPVVSVRGAIAACLIVGIAIAAWLIMKPSDEVSKIDSAEQSSFAPVQNELPADSIMANETTTESTQSPLPKKQNKAVANKKPAGIIAKPTLKNQPVKTAVITTSTESNEYESEPPVVKEESKPVMEEKAEPVVTEAPKEKKKLRDKIADLFKKKSEDKKEDAKPVEEEEGKRNSTRRETGSNLAQMVTLKFTVPNDWMMGIKGAKATLTNRSSEAIVKATVEVIYYNDDNDVVDRKTISFTDIKSKQTKTVGVPDHATATRLEYNVVSATGAGEPFARR